MNKYVEIGRRELNVVKVGISVLMDKSWLKLVKVGRS